MKKTTQATKYARRIVVLRGDTHSGQDGGLKNPATLLPEYSINEEGDRVLDGWEPVRLSPFQKRMWAWHEEARAQMISLADGDPMTMIEMGDLTHGGYFKDDAEEAGMSDQYFLSKSSLMPWLEMPQLEGIYFTRGSGVHTWFKAAETLLTHELKAEFPKTTIKLADHWMLNIDGVILDVAHHGTHPGKRAWLRGNEFMIYIRSLLIDAATEGGPVPDVVLRGHKHEFTRTWATYQVASKYWECLGIITPPMAYINAYAVMATQSISRLSIGMVALEIINGKLHKVHPFVHWIDLRTMEVIG